MPAQPPPSLTRFTFFFGYLNKSQASLDVQVHRLVELAALRLLDIRSNSVAIATVEFLEGLDLEARVDGGGALPN